MNYLNFKFNENCGDTIFHRLFFFLITEDVYTLCLLQHFSKPFSMQQTKHAPDGSPFG